VAALVVRELARRFGGVRALDGVSLSVEDGERRAVIGPNGAGKTTLFNVLSGELRPSSGGVELLGADVTGQPTWRLARRGLARVYQRTELCPSLSASENLELARLRPRGASPFSRRERDAHAGARELLARVGLEHRGERRASALSHGERRQLELAVALAADPRVLLLDEPTAGMSPAETARIVELIAALPRAVTILIVEHDMDVVFRLADRITVLHEGKVLAEGAPAEVRAHPRVREVYLGGEAIA
jgi:ABC-type branched-subunit amino acid transport system ATPase component